MRAVPYVTPESYVTEFRAPLVYLGGMRAVRSLGRIGSALCVSVGAVFFWRLLTHERIDLVPLVPMYLAGVLFAVAARLWALRSLVVTREGCTLVPIVGPSRPVPRISDVYPRGDDVVVVGTDGRTTLLGVDRFPFRDPAVVRRALVVLLRRQSG